MDNQRGWLRYLWIVRNPPMLFDGPLIALPPCLSTTYLLRKCDPSFLTWTLVIKSLPLSAQYVSVTVSECSGEATSICLVLTTTMLGVYLRYLRCSPPSIGKLNRHQFRRERMWKEYLLCRLLEAPYSVSEAHCSFLNRLYSKGYLDVEQGKCHSATVIDVEPIWTLHRLNLI